MNKKRMIAVALLFAAVLSMVGCAIKVRDFDRKDRNKQNTGAWRPGMGSLEEVVPPTQETQAETPTAAATSEAPEQQGPQTVCSMHNTVYSTFDGTTYETLAGQITFYDDNSFAMKVNLYEGWGTLTGGYRFESPGTFYCTVNRKDFSGFTGDNLQEFFLVATSEGTYAINLGDVEFLGMVKNGDYFQIVAQ